MKSGKSRMRVLMVEPSGAGGMYAYTDALCGGLCDTSADVTVLSNPSWPDLPRPFKIEKHLLKIAAQKRQWSRLLWAVDRFWRSLHNSLRRNRFAIHGCPDVVHVQFGVPLIDQFLLKPLARHWPVVLTVHDVQPHYDRLVSKRSFLKRYFHIPDRLIVHYDDGKRKLIDNWGL
ncbi:MAG: glycosyltransferase family 4 protein, partial [Planctomycetota bacterium]